MKSRTGMSFLIFILILAVFNGSVWAASEKPVKKATAEDSNLPQLSATSSILVDAERNQVLFSRQPDQRLHISAACKLMTVLIAVESGKLGSSVTISKDSVEAEGSALSLEVGEKYDLEDLLYGIMLTSANDAAKAVAEHVGGDTPKFVEKMNEMAVKLGMKDTHFSNPTGLFDEMQFTTARDISLFITYAIKNEEFRKIFTVQARPWTHQDGSTKILTSQNKLFWSYDGVNGGKTGYNKKDQHSIITTAFRNSMQLICVVLDTPEEALFSDATTLLDYGFNKFRRSILVQKGEVLKTAQAEGGNINLICSADVYYVHPVGESYIKEFKTDISLESPVKKNKPAGIAKYVLSDDTVIEVSLFPDSEITPPDDFYTTAKKKILENRDIFYLVVFLLFIEAVLILYNIGRLITRIIRKLTGHHQPTQKT